MLKLAPVSAVLLSQFVKSEAGCAESQHDQRLCALYGAFLCVFKDGNKTQVEMVKATAASYAKAEDCGALVGTPGKASAAAKRAFKLYQAYAHGMVSAFDDVAECKLLKIDGKKATVEQCQEYAERAAVIVADLVTAAITPKEKTPEEIKAAADKAAAKKAAAELAAQAAAKQAAAERRDDINKAAEKKAAKALAEGDADTVVDAMINILSVGVLSAETVAMLAEAVAAAQARTVVAAAAAPAEEVATA